MSTKSTGFYSRIKQFLHSFKLTRNQELQGRLDRHQRIFRSSHIAHGYGYFDWDLAINKMGWSGGYWRHLGYTDDDMDYISLSDNHYDYIHPADTEKVHAVVLDILKKPGPREVCYRVRSKDGNYIWSEVRCDATCNEEGRVLFISGIVMDVTQQRQMEQALIISEERNRRILQSSSDGIWEWSAVKGGFHFVKQCWEQIGYTYPDDFEGEELNGLDIWYERMHPDDISVVSKALRGHLKGNLPYNAEYRMRAKDGSWRWLRARGQAEFDRSGRAVRMSGTNVDITELKRAEEKVRNAKEQAEEANRAKSEFLSRMSHELRTPLNAIMGFAQLLEFDSNLTSQQRDNVSEIQGAGQHLLELVGDILDLSRIEAGRMTFSMERIEPVALLKDCITFFQPQAEHRKIRFYLSDNGLMHFGVTADAVRLKQIFLNLLSNSVKYNRDRGEIKIVCSRSNEEFYRVEVQDTGIGIPKEKEDLVFQPFSRLGAEQSGIEGAGVGLVITQQLINQMGGFIGFKNHDDEGCTFWVDIPVGDKGGYAENIPAEVIVSTSTAEEIPSIQLQGSRKVLYVEDNPSNQRLMSQLFSRLPQFSLVEADDAFKGLYSARAEKPDIIIMDIHLPGMNGFEALEVLKSDPETSSIPVIALSANAMAHDLQKGQEAGFIHYLTKPINLQQLVQVLNQVVLAESRVNLLEPEPEPEFD